MEIRIQKISMLLFLTCIFMAGTAQINQYDLLTEPFIDRPVNLHRHQLELNGAYRLSVCTGYFENDMSKTPLQEEGTAIIGHRSFFGIKYGLTEFIEISADLNYFSQGARSTTMIYSDLYESITVNKLTQTRGISDLAVSVSFRLPVQSKWFSWGLDANFLLPLTGASYPEPENTVERIFDEILYTTINLKHMLPNAVGIPFAGGGSELKLRLGKFAFYGRGYILFPLKEASETLWDEDLEGDTFVYYSTEEIFSPPVKIETMMNLHYQPNGWFNVFMGLSAGSESEGWFERNGFKYEKPRENFMDFNAGFGIQVAPRLRFLEIMSLPFSGRNSYSRFFISTGMSLNMFTGK